jgi:hypothetical protein
MLFSRKFRDDVFVCFVFCFCIDKYRLKGITTSFEGQTAGSQGNTSSQKTSAFERHLCPQAIHKKGYKTQSPP